MQTKWYLGTLVLILALLGFSQEQIDVPNQEIVVQFTDDEVTLDAAQNAISIVKKQLQDIGVKTIHVHESTDGRLVISYYSDIDIAGVIEMFSEEQKLAFDYTSFNQDESPSQFPSKEQALWYKLNITEIQKSVDVESDFDGILVQLLPDFDRPINPKVYFAAANIKAEEKTRVDNIAFTSQYKIALAINTPSYNIPEVRAGPAYNGLV
ncbi:MAG: hypothetical protein ACI86C_001245 [Candidatus Latescibacterota bacterium]|jgi:hypothetical protein